MSNFNVRIEMKAPDGLSTTKLSKLLFALVDQRIVPDGDSVRVNISEANAEAQHTWASFSFELNLSELLLATVKLRDLDIHYVPPLNGVPREVCEAFLNHELVYRVDQL